MAITKADRVESLFNEFGLHKHEARELVDLSFEEKRASLMMRLPIWISRRGGGLMGKRALTHAPLPQGEFSRGRVKTICIDVAISPSGRVWRQRQWPTAAHLNEAPVFKSSTTAAINENQTAAYTAVATDPDGDALTYRLEGTDALFFDIDVRDCRSQTQARYDG